MNKPRTRKLLIKQHMNQILSTIRPVKRKLTHNYINFLVD
jgi:hypothetical protein